MKDIKTTLLLLLAATPRRNLPLKISKPLRGQEDGFIYGLLVRSTDDPQKHVLWDIYNAQDVNPRTLLVSSLPSWQIADILKDCLRAERRRLDENYDYYLQSGDIADWAKEVKQYMDIENQACALFKKLRTKQ